MSIKRRIHKIGLAINPSGGFCVCRNINKFEIWHADLSVDSETSEPHLRGEAVPDVCPQCRKPIEKQMLIIQGVDHTTKDRFPEEWNAAN